MNACWSNMSKIFPYLLFKVDYDKYTDKLQGHWQFCKMEWLARAGREIPLLTLPFRCYFWQHIDSDKATGLNGVTHGTQSDGGLLLQASRLGSGGRCTGKQEHPVPPSLLVALRPVPGFGKHLKLHCSREPLVC